MDYKKKKDFIAIFHYGLYKESWRLVLTFELNTKTMLFVFFNILL